MKAKLFLKHTMSCLHDQAIEVDIDETRREVRLAMAAFDSSLVARLVTDILPTDHGLVAYRDDNEKHGTEVWLTKPATYALSIDLAGLVYRADVVKLFRQAGAGGMVAVTLTPSQAPSEQQKRAQ
ncbi:hypothetical protein ACG04R_16255 [Roseateles sp. BYS78W]|uniref:Uncharacterized protein n=1 Tax=Pelomonas candidula TaxID=3299025 RepID=A0ABW7HEA6_9BURK